MGRMGLMKGKRGEREVIALLRPVIERVYGDHGVDDVPRLQRNTLQSDAGGFDIVGLHWLAIEVKRQETLNLNAWWQQTLRQAGAGQTPVLFYKQNRKPWRVRMNTGVWVGEGYMMVLSDISIEDFLVVFERRLRWELVRELEGLTGEG